LKISFSVFNSEEQCKVGTKPSILFTNTFTNKRTIQLYDTNFPIKRINQTQIITIKRTNEKEIKQTLNQNNIFLANKGTIVKGDIKEREILFISSTLFGGRKGKTTTIFVW
jgi:hypothetical protein